MNSKFLLGEMKIHFVDELGRIQHIALSQNGGKDQLRSNVRYVTKRVSFEWN